MNDNDLKQLLIDVKHRCCYLCSNKTSCEHFEIHDVCIEEELFEEDYTFITKRIKNIVRG